MRRSRNVILGLRDAKGEWRIKHDDILHIVTQYFGDLFSTSYPNDIDDVLNCIKPTVSAANAALCRPYSHEEVNCALAQMHPHKA